MRPPPSIKDRKAAPILVPTVPESLVAVTIFLAAHVAIVLDVALGEIPSHIIVAFDVT
jgi:hypothetical protein